MSLAAVGQLGDKPGVDDVDAVCGVTDRGGGAKPDTIAGRGPRWP